MKRAKRYIIFISIICLGAVIFGCTYGRLNAKIRADSICVKSRFTGIEKTLDNDEVKEVLSILNSGDWKWGQMKLDCSHEFIMDDDVNIWYDTSGIVMDRKRDRMFRVSEEQKNYLNSIVPVEKED